MSPTSPRVYLDHHATTALSAGARAAMGPLLEDGFLGNASSTHSHGRRARSLIEAARRSLAGSIGASPASLTFTSGGTESAHLAVLGLGRAATVTSLWCDPGAHPCVVAAMESLGVERSLAVRWIPTSAEGAIDVRAFANVLLEGALVALSWVQHETGGVADIAPLRTLLAERHARWMLDAVQALGKISVAAESTGADALTFSAHKIGGLSGVGALWARGGSDLATVMPGGGQERGLRGGTENVIGIVAFGAAAAEVAERLAAMPSVASLRDTIEGILLGFGASPSIRARERVATVTHAAWAADVAGAELVAAFDVEGISVSSGAACSSGRARASASIARTFPTEPWRASGALRVSLSPTTTVRDVARFREVASVVLPRFFPR